MKISVVIPTHNRANILNTCLEKLQAQQGLDFEIIVVDDGSQDHTTEVVHNFPEVKYIKQPPSHQGVARNRGVRQATGNIILFIGDDIFVEPDFLQKHHDAHAANPDDNVIVLGFSTWDPAIEINDYMRFLESSGWQFGYGKLSAGFVSHPEPYKFFYTSNISLKKSFFEKERFDENFKVYGWEDIELGYRLWKNHAMKLFYEPEAKALHHHFLPEDGLSKKMQNVGKSAVVFKKLQPEANIMPSGLKSAIIKIASNPITLPCTRLLGKNTHYKLKSWQEFYKGAKNLP